MYGFWARHLACAHVPADSLDCKVFALVLAVGTAVGTAGRVWLLGIWPVSDWCMEYKVWNESTLKFATGRNITHKVHGIRRHMDSLLCMPLLVTATGNVQ